jgi:phosphatidylglycerophosphate synthase
MALIIFTISIPVKKIIKKESYDEPQKCASVCTLTYFETKLNYFFDEFFVYGAVILLSLHNFAPFWIVIIYFYKDATIGAVRNFAIKNDEPLHEKYGYKIDKLVQYSVILISAFTLAYKETAYFKTSTITKLFYASAAISMLTLIVFFFLNKDFMRKIHNT